MTLGYFYPKFRFYNVHGKITVETAVELRPTAETRKVFLCLCVCVAKIPTESIRLICSNYVGMLMGYPELAV